MKDGEDYYWRIVAPKNGSSEQINLMNARIIGWLPNGMIRELDAEQSKQMQETIFDAGTSIARIFHDIIAQ